MTLEPNQLVHVVLLGEAFYNAVSMLPDASCEVAGDAYVEHPSRSVGEDVDAGEFQGGGRGGWRPLNGDGGGGYFYGVSGGSYTDNGGTIIVPGGGTGSSAWIRVVENVLTVKMFGAKGDGDANDTTPIQNAINFITTGRGNIPPSLTLGNGALCFPSGTYLITSIIFYRHLK